MHDAASSRDPKDSDWCVVASPVPLFSLKTNAVRMITGTTDTSGLRSSYLGPPESISV